MRLTGHALAAIPLAGVLGWTTGNWPAAGAGAALSVLVDLDHLPDYIHWRGGWRSLKDFFETNRHHQVDRLLLFMHGLEWPLPLAALLWWLAGPAWGLCLGAGWLYHLAWDLAVNPVAPRFYFFFFRKSGGFSRSRLRSMGCFARLDRAMLPD